MEINSYLGELAALGAATCWGIGSLLFGYAAVRVGAIAVNSIRVPLAAALFLIATLLSSGTIIPDGVTGTQILWLVASGLVGIVVGDTAFYKSITILGPRKTSLLTAASPVFATSISWIILGQHLGLVALSGVVLTLGGVVWVVRERAVVGGAAANGGSRRLGVILGLVAALSQAVSLVLAKLGLADTMPPMNASFIRMAAGIPGIWLIVLLQGRARESWRAIRDNRSLASMLSAVFIGPFTGIWLSLVAINISKVGIAATLMATTPILMIPMVRIVYNERASFRAVLGTVVAIVGISLIFAR